MKNLATQDLSINTPIQLVLPAWKMVYILKILSLLIVMSDIPVLAQSPGISDEFPRKLAFIQQPYEAAPNVFLNSTIQVAVINEKGEVILNDSRSIDLSLVDESNNSILRGVLTENAVKGIAVFDSLAFVQPGRYRLEASAWGFDPVYSDTILIRAKAQTQGKAEAQDVKASTAWKADMAYWLDAHDLDGDGNAEGIAGESGQTSSQVSTWINKTGGTNFTNTAGQFPGSNPDLKEGQINFNETIAFNESGFSDYLGAAVTNFPSTGITQFIVLSSTGSGDGIFSYEISARSNEFVLFAQEDLRIFSQSDFKSTGFNLNNGEANILSVDRLGSSGSTKSFVNGLAAAGNSFTIGTGDLQGTGTIILAQEQDDVGGGFDGGQAFEGQLAEVITYSKVLSDLERQSVESYLAIKYGITLDQSSGTDYLAANGTVLWDYSENTSYTNDIGGIGKDNDSDLNQPKSKSENSDAILTIGKNASVTLVDGAHLLWGNNNGSTSTTEEVIVGTQYGKMTRQWRFQEKNRTDAGSGIGTVTELGNIDIAFDLSGIYYAANEVRLLIDDDGIFGPGSTVSSVIGSFEGDVVTFSNVDVDDGQFISVALFGIGPGGVAENLVYWLDAHDLDGDGNAEGIAGESGQTSSQVSTWVNKKGGTNFTNTAGQSAGTTPDLKEGQINFNETIAFNESVDSDYLGTAVTNFPTTGITQFVVFNSLGSQDGIFSYNTSVRDNEFLLYGQENLSTYFQGASKATGFELNSGDANILSVDRLSSSASTKSFVNGLGAVGNSFTIGSGNLGSIGTIILAQDQDIVGGEFQSSQAFKGQMAEVITYSTVLGDLERQSVESYLAIKYGVTLDQSIGKDYLASNQVAVWDYSENITYINDIAGIGRDEVSTLSQPKSKSENNDAILTIEAAGSMTNGRFLFWANNNASLSTTSNSTANGIDYDLMDRTWRIQERSMIDGGSGIGTQEDFGLVNVTFDLTGINYDPDRVRLFDDQSVNFISTIIPIVSNNQVTFSGVDLAHNTVIGLVVDFSPKLAFTIQPTNTIVDNIINEGAGVSVTALDIHDEAVTSFTESIALSVGIDPSGSATLSGTLSKSAVGGVATFDNISLDQLGEGYTLQAASTGLFSVTSTAFNIQNSAPGGVLANLGLWLKADGDVYSDAGVTLATNGNSVEQWNDASGDQNNAEHTVAVQKPTLSTGAANFNPALDFNGAEAMVGTAGGYMNEVFIVIVPDNEINKDLVAQAVYVADHDIENFAGLFLGSSTIAYNDELISVFGGSNGFSDWRRGQVDASFSYAADIPIIISFNNENSSQSTEIYKNGLRIDNASVNTWRDLDVDQNYIIGAEESTTNGYFDGKMAEVINYSTKKGTIHRNQIQSYLALKYGITLDQNTGTDYLNSAGNVVWDYSDNSTYVEDIAGIGRDDNSGLSQKQSKSINSDAIVAIGLDDDVTPDGLETTNILNDGSFSADRSFLIWSNDGAAIDDGEGNEEFDPNEGVTSRLNREWFVQVTGSIGTVTIEFDVSTIAGPTGIGTNDESQIQLLLDTDGDFSGGSQALVSQSLVTPDDGLVRFRVFFPDNTYFTLVSAENNALPVELISFEAKPHVDYVSLEWVTASESAGITFRVERAASDFNFKAIATLESQGGQSGLSNYIYRDLEPNRGVNYYRLIDVNEQGNEVTSEIIRIKFSPEPNVKFMVYPNPVQRGELLNIKLPIPSKEGIEVMLVTRDGRQLRPKLTAGTLNGHWMLHTSRLKSGIYYLRLISQDGRIIQHSKFLIRD